MRKFYLLSTLVLTILWSNHVVAQDFSNKGKEFYLCFPNHVPSGANMATLSIYITSDKASSGTITMANSAFSATFNIPANGLQEIPIPWNANIHIANTESNTVIKKSIHIKTDPGKPPVVAYAQQWAGARSAATLLLPTNVVGKKYYAISFAQNGSNQGTFLARSQFQIIAVKDNTVINITPVKNGVVGTQFQITLPLAGDMYQYQSTDANAATQDLTGTFIESTASPTGGCLPIVVFSGSSNVTFGTPSCSGGSYDPLWQQLYPISTWGKNFGLIPFRDYPNGVPYRVMASQDNTKIFFDGALVATLNKGQIFPNAFTGNPAVLLNPTYISSDQPICVAEYAQADACTGQTSNPRVGDPDMVILNPIEQNIKDITIFSSSNQAITRNYINVLIKTNSTASFTINGVPPATPWQAFPTLPGYSYLRHQLPGAGSYRITADSSFNAICYGWGNVESYSYSAGTNVKDLYQQIGVSTQYGIEPSPSVCKGSPFRFKVSFPYCVDSINWDLSLLPGPPATVPTQIYTTCTPGAGGPDSTTVVNGVTLYWYSLPTFYTFNVAGAFPVSLTTYTPTTLDGCGNQQDIDFELNVYDPPVADFTIINSGCVAEAVKFSDNTVTPRPSYIWNWDFGDPASGLNNTSGLQNPQHFYSAPGTYTVKFSTITTPGCISSEITKQVTVAPIPTATITGATTVCVNDPTPFVTFTAADGTAPYTFSYHINAGPAIQLPSPTATITVAVPTGTAGTYRYYLDSVKNTGSTLCKTIYPNTFVDVVVNANTGLALNAGSNDNQAVCQNNAITDIFYTISGGGNNATVSGLPAGVTYIYNNATHILTITGTPTDPTGSPYTYTVTATGLCLPNTKTGVITVNPDATLLLGAGGSDAQIVCQNINIVDIHYNVGGGATNANVTGLPAGVTWSYAAGVVTITGAPVSPVGSPFTYTVTTTGTCVQKSVTGTITVNPDATLVLGAGGTASQTVCENIGIVDIKYNISGGGTGATVTGLPAGVTWSYAAGVVTITGAPLSAVGSPFTYTVTTTGTCLQKALTGIITVNPDATLSLGAGGSDAQTVCQAVSIVDIKYNVGGGGTNANVTGLPAGVTWSYAGGVVTITGAPTTAIGSPFTYTVSTTGSCAQKSMTGTITVNKLPLATFTFTNPACDTRDITFTNTSTPNAVGPTQWLWNFGDPGSGALNTSAVFSPTHVFTNPSPPNYTVTLNAINSNGCISNPDGTAQVTINQKPLAEFSVPEVCINDAATVFPDGSTIASGSISAAGYYWDFGDPGSGPLNTSTTMNGSHLYTAIGLYHVMHVATSTLGCKDTVYHDIFINAADPIADYNVTNPATLCSNDSVSIVNRSTISQGSVTKIEVYWDVVGAPATFDLVNTPVFNEVYKHKYPTLQTTQNYTVRMIAYSGTICFSNKTTVITVNAAPKVQFNNMPDACLDAAPFQITQASEIGGVPGAGTYSGPGVSPTGIFNPASVGPGTYLIKYTFTSSAAGCIDTLSKYITVLDSASAQFTYSAVPCEKTAVNFNSSTSTIPVASGTITGWNWNFGDPASGANNTSTSPNPSHLFTGWGNYTVKLFVTTSTGCKSTVRTINVFVNPIPRPNFTIPASACLPSATVTFNNTSTIPDGTQATFSYNWNFGDPPSGVLNTSTGTNPSHIYTAVGPYNVNLQVMSGAGCPHDTTIVLNTIHPEPKGAFTTNKNDVCIGQSITFTDNSNPADGTTTSWSWNLGDGNTRTSSSFTYTYGTAGPYVVTLFITNSNGCKSSTATRTVTINPYPVVDAGPDLFILQDGSDTLEPVVTAINPSYLWTPNMYFLSSNTIKNAIVKGVEDITYTLTVTGQGDCVSTDKVFIKVLKGPEIPNIFSPNGDGVHDKWEIKYLDTYPGGTVDIFNRYGQLIFHSVGYGVPWDGTVNGKEVPVGTYYYIVNPKNGRSIMSGYVDVIR